MKRGTGLVTRLGVAEALVVTAGSAQVHLTASGYSSSGVLTSGDVS
jgi:hypothetical protein